MAWFKSHIFPWLGVGILLGVGFLWPLFSVAGLVGAGWYLKLVFDPTRSFRQKLFGSWVAWTLKYLAALAWFWSTYPIAWLPVELGDLQLVLIGVYWFTASLWLGSGGMLFAAGAWYLQSLKLSWYWCVLPVALLWVGAEIGGAFIFSVITLGEGGAITSAFSFGFTGFLLAEHEVFLQLARVAGVYGLSFLFGGLAVLLTQSFLWAGRSRWLGLLGVGGFALTMSVPVATWQPERTTSPSHTVDIVDTQFPVAQTRTEAGRRTIRTSYAEAIQASYTTGSEYIILPEDARFFDQTRPTGSLRSLFDLQFDRPNLIVVDSGRVDLATGGVAVQAFVFDGVNDRVERAQKRYLVPQGEFMPTLYAQTLRLTGFATVVDRVAEDISYRVGTKTDQSGFGSQVPGVLFCFESVDPRGVRRILSERGTVPFIAHPISHAWFHEPRQLWHQLDTMLKVQAVWNQVPIVSAGNHVAGAVYLPTGERLEPRVVTSGEAWTVRRITIPQL